MSAYDTFITTGLYKHKRDQIVSGDLLAWSNTSNSLLSKILSTIVRFVTMSEFSHVGIAYTEGGRLYVLEASLPRIRLVPVSSKEAFYWIPMHVEWSHQSDTYLKEHLGKSYSIADAIRGYFGVTHESDDRWQCAELCHDFYNKLGINLGDAYTPSKLVKHVLYKLNTSITYIAN